MHDKKETKLIKDDQRIDPNKELDLRYWSAVLKSNPNELKEAVKNAGSAVADVKKFLHPESTRDYLS